MDEALSGVLGGRGRVHQREDVGVQPQSKSTEVEQLQDTGEATLPGALGRR